MSQVFVCNFSVSFALLSARIFLNLALKYTKHSIIKCSIFTEKIVNVIVNRSK